MERFPRGTLPPSRFAAVATIAPNAVSRPPEVVAEAPRRPSCDLSTICPSCNTWRSGDRGGREAAAAQARHCDRTRARFQPAVDRAQRRQIEAVHHGPITVHLAAGVVADLLHVGFLTASDPAIRVARSRSARHDRFTVIGREIYLHYPRGVGKSKLTNAYFEKRSRRSARFATGARARAARPGPD